MSEADARARYERLGIGRPWDQLSINQRRLIAVLFDKNDREAEGKSSAVARVLADPKASRASKSVAAAALRHGRVQPDDR